MLMNNKKIDIVKLIQNSESLDSKVSEDSREALRSLIDQGEGIGYLVHYYSTTQSFRALDLLCRIKEPHDTELCNRMQECMEKNPLATIILLGQIVQKSPSWLSKLSDHPLFASLLRLIRTSQNTVIVVGGILFVTALIPHLCALKHGILNELFGILLFACNLLYKRKKAHDKDPSDPLESVYVSHLYCAITQYFVVLYGIYPTNLLAFLRERFANSADNHAFVMLEPVFAVVKFHPQLVKMDSVQEVDRIRWSQREAHDFVAECRHVIVRPTAAVLVTNLPERVTLTRSAKSSSAARLRELHSLLSSSRSSSSINQSSTTSESNGNWDDMWSPSVNLGLETPPETRSATPLVQRSNTLANSTIVPGSAGSRRSTASSEDLRRPRRASFGQKLGEFFRGKRPVERGDEKRSPLPREKVLAATKEEVEDIEIIDALPDSSRRNSEGNRVEEEGLDATEMRTSPSSTVSVQNNGEAAQSPILTPSTIVGNDMEQPLTDKENDVERPRSNELQPRIRSSSLVALKAETTTAIGSAPDEKDDTLVQETVENDDQNCASEASIGIIPEGPSNRFSVSSFFRAVNRQRFISECPPLNIEVDHDDVGEKRRKRVLSSMLKRSTSCPEVVEGVVAYGTVRKSDASMAKSLVTAQPALTAAKIHDHIDREFPYLAFLKALLLPSIDEESMDADLKKEHERTRDMYMRASLEHHNCLKQIGLADRLPAKIYDDMVNLIHGLSLEKQRDILNTRLSLVNQHLMYERCGRLLHAERNRRLFGRIKQQKLSDAEKISLQKALHGAQVEREDLVKALTDLRKKGMVERAVRQDVENHYREELKRSCLTSERHIAELEKMSRRVDKLNEVNEQLQFDLDTMRRRCENAEVQLSFAESKIAELENIRPELRKAYRSNQELRDKIALSEIQARAANMEKVNERSVSNERDERQLLEQISQLKNELKKERNMKDAEKVKSVEMEEEWKEERQRSNELKLQLERAAMLHAQQSEAAQHKYLSLLSVCQKQQSHILDLYAHIEKLMKKKEKVPSNAQEAAPLPIPKSTVPDEILSYESSHGSENTSFFPSDLFSPPSSVTNGSGFRELNQTTSIIALPHDRIGGLHIQQSGTL